MSSSNPRQREKTPGAMMPAVTRDHAEPGTREAFLKMDTPFEILGVSYSATDEQVKAAYLKRIREFPPERFPEKFKTTKHAFEQIQSLRDRVSYRLFHTPEPDMNSFLKAMKLQPGKRIPAETLLQIIAAAARERLKSPVVQ